MKRAKTAKVKSNDETSKSINKSEEIEEEEWYIEEVVGEGLGDNNKIEYYVKWLDWGDEWNTWEPREHLEKNFPNELARYEEKRKKRSRSRRLSGTSTANHQLDTRDQIEGDGNYKPRTSQQCHPDAKHKVQGAKSTSRRGRKPKTTDKSKVQDNLAKVKTEPLSPSCPTSLASQVCQIEEAVPGRQPEKIIGAEWLEGKRLVLIKFKDSDSNKWLPFKEVIETCPHLVFAFYETIGQWLMTDDVELNNQPECRIIIT